MKRTNIQARVWREHNGPVPRDEDGRSFDIHHIDGDPTNNNISNLIAVSIKDHYDIHVDQGDYGAAFMIGSRMKVKPEDLSEIVKQQMKRIIEAGTHNLSVKGYASVKDVNNKCLRVKKDDPRYLSGELVGVNKGYVTVRDCEGNKLRVKKDDPRYLSGELVGVNKGYVVVVGDSGECIQVSKDDPRYLSGELKSPHSGREGLNKGKSWTQKNKRKRVVCPHCSKEGDSSLIKRHHFDNCKLKKDKIDGS